jgi:uncharacterized membrane protein
MTESPGIVHEVDREPRAVVFAWLPGDRRVVTRKNPAWLGWTLNLANPRSWVVVAVILVVWRWTRRS